MTEPEDYSDENGWGVLGDVLEELMYTDVPGVVVLVIVVVATIPYIAGIIRSWRGKP